MPLMAAHEQDDARGAAWLLAITAQDCLRNPQKVRAHKAALVNTYRLLESYRTSELFGVARLPPVHSQESIRTLAETVRLEHDISDVQKALDESLGDVFGDGDRGVAIDTIESALRSVAYPKDFPGENSANIKKAQKFLDKFIDRLGR